MAAAVAASQISRATVVGKTSSTISKSINAQNAIRRTNNSILEPGQTVVIPRWWTGRYDAVCDPARFLVDGQGKITKADLHANSDLGQELQHKYNDVGLVHVHNTGLTNMADQRTLARILMGEETEYEGGANPRGRAADLGNVYDIGAPLEAALAYHHEVTYKSHSVESLGFLCKHAVQRDQVGWSFVSDSVQAHDYIMTTPLGQKLKEKGLCFVRRMTDATSERDIGALDHDNPSLTVYNHWQQSWMTNDPEEAEAAAHKQGLLVEWVPQVGGGHMMQTRYYKSAFEYVPGLDRNIMATSIADDGEWFDSWPGIKDVPQELRPLEMYFGDDTPFTLEEKQAWTDAYDMFGIPLPWQAGDVAVLCNLRYAHGRPGIHLLPGEQRELGVMLGSFFERQETKEGKW
ncbi:Taurine catabolism dioxygenase TauD, TfdA family [Seminavis robusta]|uniref:Taurine catabolism dioxygenase TauD, TfdA family n=1 Tax=Seminavis robusta TaxID=568900 RepID=A0A9N8E2L9_9STRA|nr:Taurine catabolism dioxygenase TauD, TfdA family [Seminavis robusta]|eukprot:Sro555_g165760.1 Taurine catabolism dioxygenase TauD, TfdA family (404) ;mRNA; f:45070-46281